jgi:hypothetical protein
MENFGELCIHAISIPQIPQYPITPFPHNPIIQLFPVEISRKVGGEFPIINNL